MLYTLKTRSADTHTGESQLSTDMPGRVVELSPCVGQVWGQKNHLWISCCQVAETECLHGSLSTEGPPRAAFLLLPLLLLLYVRPHLLLSEWTVEWRVRMRMC